MKQITFSDKQFYKLLQFTSEYTSNIIERSLDWGDSTYADELMESNHRLLIRREVVYSLFQGKLKYYL